MLALITPVVIFAILWRPHTHRHVLPLARNYKQLINRGDISVNSGVVLLLTAGGVHQNEERRDETRQSQRKTSTWRGRHPASRQGVCGHCSL